MYAIVDIAGQQFKVEKNNKMFVHRLENEEGSQISLDRVLLLDNNGKITVGEPLVEGASIIAKVVSHVKGDKVLVFKKKRRKGYQVLNGHRQYFTEIVIEEILEKGQKAKVTVQKAVEKKETKVTTAKDKETTKKTTSKTEVKSQKETTAKPKKPEAKVTPKTTTKIKSEKVETKISTKKAAPKATAKKTAPKTTAKNAALKTTAKKTSPKTGTNKAQQAKNKTKE